MPYTDYKIWYVKRDDDQTITEIGVRFYQGDYQLILDKSGQPVLTYIRSVRLQTNNLSYLGSIKTVKDAQNKDVVIYTQKDFGQTNSLDSVRSFLNGKLKLSLLTPIPEQNK